MSASPSLIGWVVGKSASAMSYIIISKLMSACTLDETIYTIKRIACTVYPHQE